MANLSGRVRTQLLARMKARLNGLIASLAPTHAVQPFTFDFDSIPRSPSVFLGQLDPDDIEESTTFRYPLLCLYITSSANRASQKPAKFAGMIQAQVDVHLSWRGGNANMDFDATGDLLESAMCEVMQDATQQNWGIDVLYTGNFGLVRGPMRKGAENWQQMLRFTFLFEVIG